jgi:hypothetical protein
VHIKTHCLKNLYGFAYISGTDCDILYSEKQYTKITTKTRIQYDCTKILKTMHILVYNRNFEKQKSGIPKSPNQRSSSTVNKEHSISGGTIAGIFVPNSFRIALFRPSPVTGSSSHVIVPTCLNSRSFREPFSLPMDSWFIASPIDKY